MLTEQQLTSVLATERRIYAALSEVLELTGELSASIQRGDSVSVQLFLQLRQEPINQLREYQTNLVQQLASGHLFVALMTRGHFTERGHFIILRGVTLEGRVLVADPNSRERSLAAWEPQLILDELSSSRSSGAPLWRISMHQ